MSIIFRWPTTILLTIATMILLLLTLSQTDWFAIVSVDIKSWHAGPVFGVIFRPTAENFLPLVSYTSILFNVKFPTIPSKPNLPSFIHRKCMQDTKTHHITLTSYQIRKHLFMEQDSDVHFIQLLPIDAIAASTYRHKNAAKGKSSIPLLAGKLRFVFRKQALQRAETEMHTKCLTEWTELLQKLNQSLIPIDTITDDNYVIHESLFLHQKYKILEDSFKDQ